MSEPKRIPELTKFLKEPNHDTLEYLLMNAKGEHSDLEFKQQWPHAEALSKHILAIANYGGGCLAIGIGQKENDTTFIGLEELKGKEKIHDEIKRYLPEALHNIYRILDFPYNNHKNQHLNNKKFQVLTIEYSPQNMPFTCEADGKNIYQNRIYTRRHTKSTEVNYLELQRILNIRIETGYSSTKELDLREQLKQLKLLYSELEKFDYSTPFSTLTESLNHAMGTKKTKNPNYPDESFEEFIQKQIEDLKRKIQLNLGTSDRYSMT